MKPQWLFVHVMKTAGTSFRRMLEKSLGPKVYPTKEELKKQNRGWYLKARPLCELVEERPDLFSGRVILCGHYSPRVCEVLPGKWRLATFIREPVSRSISMLSHRLKHDLPHLYLENPGALANEAEKLLDNDRFVNAQIRNYQTKVFSAGPLANINTPREVGQQDLGLALERLRGFEFIGVTEDFEASVKRFELISGLALRQKILHQNRGLSFELGADVVAQIRSLTALDAQLYASCRDELFRESV